MRGGDTALRKDLRRSVEGLKEQAKNCCRGAMIKDISVTATADVQSADELRKLGTSRDCDEGSPLSSPSFLRKVTPNAVCGKGLSGQASGRRSCQKACEASGGSGGGKPDSAMGGIKDLNARRGI